MQAVGYPIFLGSSFGHYRPGIATDYMPLRAAAQLKHAHLFAL